LDLVSRTDIGEKTMKTPGAETEIYTIARRWVECGWQKGQSEVVDELHAPNFVDHNPAGRGSDNHGFKEGIVQLYAAFPDFYARIEDILIDGVQSKATVRWTATGTHRGAFMGCDPTGRVIRFKCIEIIRIDNGRIAERWGEWNPVELLEQLRSQKRRPQSRADSKRRSRLGSSQQAWNGVLQARTQAEEQEQYSHSGSNGLTAADGRSVVALLGLALTGIEVLRST
jgi:steroid delta-isomerase-like uncharacterized protein